MSGLLITGLGLAPIFPSMLHETPARFGEAHAQKIMGYQMDVAYTGTTLMPPLPGLLAGLSTIGIFPLYIVALAADMMLFSERLNILQRSGTNVTKQSTNTEDRSCPLKNAKR